VNELRRANPRLIYCSLSGYGQDGPYREVKAYDLLVQGESGILLTNGTPEQPAKVGLPITDLIAGMHAALGIVAALLRRDQTGEGAYLDIGMLESAASWLAYYPHHRWHAGEEPPRSGMRHQYLCPYGPFLASDGRYVNVVVASDPDWRRFCSALRKPEWADDPRFATIPARAKARRELEALIQETIASASSEVWLERLSEAELPHGRVRSIEEVLTHPQLEARGLFIQADSPVGPLPLVRFPLAAMEHTRVPALGEDSKTVLAELGYSQLEIEELHAKSLVGQKA
jgi:crotonobetainyl-CoA:carnitine CoA-transferase CaiB-like acyl-CoA transferase